MFAPPPSHANLILILMQMKDTLQREMDVRIGTTLCWYLVRIIGEEIIYLHSSN